MVQKHARYDFECTKALVTTNKNNCLCRGHSGPLVSVTTRYSLCESTQMCPDWWTNTCNG
jgi:hypothetical protein